MQNIELSLARRWVICLLNNLWWVQHKCDWAELIFNWTFPDLNLAVKLSLTDVFWLCETPSEWELLWILIWMWRLRIKGEMLILRVHNLTLGYYQREARRFRSSVFCLVVQTLTFLTFKTLSMHKNWYKTLKERNKQKRTQKVFFKILLLSPQLSCKLSLNLLKNIQWFQTYKCFDTEPLTPRPPQDRKVRSVTRM